MATVLSDPEINKSPTRYKNHLLAETLAAVIH